MKNAILSAVGFVLSFIFAYAPESGLVYLVVMIGSGISAYLEIGPVTLAAMLLSYGWKLYLFFVVFTMFAMTTFTYQNCCIGMNTFRNHLLHASTRHIENLLTSIFWPVSWTFINRWLNGWTLNWLYVVLGTFEYWLVTVRKGVKIDTLDFQSGEHKTTYSNSPDETMNVLKQTLTKTLEKEG
ncbi:hypothetical protein HY967_04005 [Candidatus Jorgensenbacteria bacterium]|nr:hypothetical protein [Candidatus Jorgensenbacteria bacterium]